MASERRKDVAASKGEDILGVVSPPRHGPAARELPRAPEPRSPGSGPSSKYHTAEEPPKHKGKLPARSRHGLRSDVAEHNAVSPVSSAANTRHKGPTPNKRQKVVHYVKPLPSNKPLSSPPRDFSKKHAYIHARSGRSSKSELQAKTEERPDNNVVQGQKAVATANSLESKGTRSGKKEESQQYLTAPERANAAPENAKYGESLLDEGK
ncbi:hypothetical protein MTO96_050513 [Rhipicephalus appendiculatus]